MHTGGNNSPFARVDEDAHERRSKGAHQHADAHAEHCAAQARTADALFDAVGLARAVVLGHIGGKRIAEVLHRHVGKGIDLDRRRKRRHDHGAKAVHKTLHHQDAKVHDGLLDTGHDGQIEDDIQILFVPAAVGLFGAQLREFFESVQPDANAGHELREHCCARRALHSPVQHQHAHKVQNDVQHRRNRQKQQRHHRVANGAQQVCKVVIQKSSRNAQKDDEQVFLHQWAQLLRHPQHPQDSVQSQIHQHVQHQRDACNEDERKEHALPHPVLLAAAILHGNGRTAAHAQAQQNRGEEGHEGIGRAHCRQRVCAEKAAHYPCIRNVVHLLQQIAQHQRQSKQQNAAGDGAFGQTTLHCFRFSFL